MKRCECLKNAEWEHSVSYDYLRLGKAWFCCFGVVFLVFSGFCWLILSFDTTMCVGVFATNICIALTSGVFACFGLALRDVKDKFGYVIEKDVLVRREED